MEKICNKCRKELQNTILICPGCGGRDFSTASQIAQMDPILDEADDPSVKHVVNNNNQGFTGSITTCLTKYAVFSGRASRSEYWWFFLFVTIIELIIEFLYSTYPELIILNVLNLGLILPSLGVCVRRLHDTGRSGWWWFIWLTGLGIPVLLYFLCSRGDVHANKYG